uniref:Uncharacterized protein n=1 Tax=Oryza sativa subsp. japonica TaxID=39947 RepID=Q6EQZ5_ORYSJ|nr:hypothetical protein [Oryza sativa Japonica Group]
MEDADIPPRLFSDSDLDLVGDREMQAYHMLKDRLFAHIRAYDPKLLRKIGMNLDFRKVFTYLLAELGHLTQGCIGFRSPAKSRLLKPYRYRLVSASAIIDYRLSAETMTYSTSHAANMQVQGIT